MKKPQNRFIEEIEKDSAGSFAGSSENRSSGAGVAGKNDSSRKCGARRDGSFADKKYIMEGWKSLKSRDFRDPGSSRAGVAETPFSVRGNLSKHWFSECCGYTFAFR